MKTSLAAKIAKVQELSADYQAHPFTRARALLEMDELLTEVAQDLQALAQKVDTGCCNTFGEKCDFLHSIGLANDQN